MARWPLKYKVWHYLHSGVNWVAWRLVPTTNVKDPRNKHWIWKLNNWVANHYTGWYVQQIVNRQKGRK